VEEGDDSDGSEYCVSLRHLSALLEDNQNWKFRELHVGIRKRPANSTGWDSYRPLYRAGQHNILPCSVPVGQQGVAELAERQTSVMGCEFKMER
jgi:hypothetical protein